MDDSNASLSVRHRLLGQTFGRWTAVALGSGSRDVICECSCGTRKEVKAYNLKSGASQSCGCLRREQAVVRLTVHGMRDTPEYRIWKDMRNRCFNPAGPAFARYGGRGITICERWRTSFKAFYEDMGPRPSPKHSIDRIDNDGNYEPSNCHWATVSEQALNRCSTRLITYKGETLPLSHWAERMNISRYTLAWRLDHSRWSVQQALETPVRN